MRKNFFNLCKLPLEAEKQYLLSTRHLFNSKCCFRNNLINILGIWNLILTVVKFKVMGYAKLFEEH